LLFPANCGSLLVVIPHHSPFLLFVVLHHLLFPSFVVFCCSLFLLFIVPGRMPGFATYTKLIDGRGDRIKISLLHRSGNGKLIQVK
jgi:hypothetical protein